MCLLPVVCLGGRPPFGFKVTGWKHGSGNHYGGQLAYALKHKGKILLDKSPIGLVLEDRTLGENVKVRRVNRRSMVKEDIVSPHYRFPAFVVTYNELDLKLRDNYGVVFRAYDEGIAYRFLHLCQISFSD